MKLTLLLDLDDTLLDNDLDTFLPAYLKALSKTFTHLPGEEMINQLMYSTNKMLSKNSPTMTLEQTFDNYFYPGIGRTKQEMAAQIDSFYQNTFPRLETLTKTRPDAINMVKKAIDEGAEVVIATNPLFPRAAILQRLEWACLPVDKMSFALVTSYEQMHFSKPNPAYYAEVLAQLGWLNQPAVMVGNSLEDDILPAEKLGMPTFLINGDDFKPRGPNPLSRMGKIRDIPNWLETIQPDGNQFKFETIDAILAVLKSTPAALETLLKGLKDEQWQSSPEEGGWSITEIACHLRDVDQEINWERIHRISTENNPFFVGEVTDSWAEERHYADQNGPAAFKSFIDIRSRLIQLLESLSPEDWKRPARHTIFGPTSLIELVKFTITHDRNHIQQIWEILKSLSPESK